MSEKESFKPGAFRIEKNCGCKFTKKEENSPEKNIDIVLNTQTGKIEDVLCNAKYVGNENKICILLSRDSGGDIPCPYMKKY